MTEPFDRITAERDAHRRIKHSADYPYGTRIAYYSDTKAFKVQSGYFCQLSIILSTKLVAEKNFFKGISFLVLCRYKYFELREIFTWNKFNYLLG